jgi:TonB family protein
MRSLLVILMFACAAHADETPPPTLKPPRLKHFIEAVPPPALAERGHAEVVLTIDVDERGKIVKLEVAQPAGDGFDEAALEAAKKFEFEPGEYGGKPVPVRVTYKYKFVYKAPPAPPKPVVEKPKPVTVPFAGEVRQRGERNPLAGVNVIVDETLASTVTDDKGRFSFEGLPPGPHVIKLRSPNIYAAEVKIALTAGKRTDSTFWVLIRERYVSRVRAEKVVVQTVETTLSGEEIRRIPGTQGDTVKAVQNLPGVARSPFNGGLLVVWGSAPNDTRTYVDGVFVPTLFHFGGLRATVNSEIVDSLTFRPGGYNVEFGRGMGGVVEIETRKPKSDGVHGFVQLDAIDASLMIEAKLTKTLSLAVGVRRSTVDAWLGAVTPNNFQLVPTYYDYQAKLTWRPNVRNQLDIFLFGSDDALNLHATTPDPAASAAINSHIFYHRLIARFIHRFDRGASLTLTAAVGYDVPFNVQAQFGTVPFNVDVELVPYTLRAVARVPIIKQLRLDAGIDFEGTSYFGSAKGPAAGPPQEGDPALVGGSAGQFATTQSTIYINNFAPFVALHFSVLNDRLQIVPQLRFDLYSWSGYVGTPDSFSHTYANWEPRLLVRAKLAKWATLKAAVGVYHQPPDTYRLFHAVGNPDLVPQYSNQYVLGVEFDPTPTLHIEALGFYNDLRQRVVRSDQIARVPFDNDGVGRVYGGELLVRQELWKGLFGWISYTLSRSERRDHPDQPWRLFQFDQTHILTIIASYKLPKGFQIGARFRYVTGNPQTPVVGSYVNGNTGGYQAIYGATYSTRLPDFHQLDIRGDKTFTFNRWKLSIYLDIQNVYNNRGSEGLQYNFDFTQNQPLAGLPFIPALGIRGDF